MAKSNKPTIASLKEELEAAKAAIEDLEFENIALQEEHKEQLIEAGILERETMLSKIQDHEEACRQFIVQVIAECEKVTGRQLQNPTYPEPSKTGLKCGEDIHKRMSKEFFNTYFTQPCTPFYYAGDCAKSHKE